MASCEWQENGVSCPNIAMDSHGYRLCMTHMRMMLPVGEKQKQIPVGHCFTYCPGVYYKIGDCTKCGKKNTHLGIDAATCHECIYLELVKRMSGGF